ncbi:MULTISPECIES: hypothetical protein [Sphingobacterium]|uniref:hypothetical protein n=1 Tax=Sphingobacterium TaxID=28453 RepID=UPI00257A7B9F|nr:MULTISPECIES: hypothetical protein [Sphingobacterium]
MINILKISLFIIFSYSIAALAQKRDQLNDNGPKTEHSSTTSIAPQKTIYEKTPNIKSVYLAYKAKQPYYVIISFLDKKVNETYNLDFEGDIFILSKKYPEIYKLTSESYLKNIAINDSLKIDENFKALIFKRERTDFEVFNGDLDQTTKKQLIENIWATPPKLKAGNVDLVNKISSALKNNKLKAPIDSIQVFKVRIDKKGVFKESELLFGRESSFSRLIKKILSDRETFFFKDGTSKFLPAIRLNTAAPFETNLKIYVRLQPDGNIIIKTPLVQRNWSGEITQTNN